MSVIKDVMQSYRSPRRIFIARVGNTAREDRALAVLMGACILVFAAQWPRLARISFETGQDRNMLLGAAMLGWVFIMPLVFYAFGTLSHMIAKVFKAQGTAYRARFALFWALLCASPLWLLSGLVAGFIGPSPQLTITGFIALLAFIVHWSINFREAEWGHNEI